jgi:hypothetical protein
MTFFHHSKSSAAGETALMILDDAGKLESAFPSLFGVRRTVNYRS